MATAAGTSSQEYWRPSNPDVARVVTTIRGSCLRCGTAYSVGARYCHSCGSARDARQTDADPLPDTLDTPDSLGILKLGLSIPCLAFLVLGIVCALAALLTGMVYRADTLVDWQAVQLWRIEWLLAAMAAFLAGILLKRKNGSS